MKLIEDRALAVFAAVCIAGMLAFYAWKTLELRAWRRTEGLKRFGCADWHTVYDEGSIPFNRCDRP